MKELVGENRQFYLMAADGFYPQIEAIRDICKELDIWLMESGVHRMNEARDQGKVFHSLDGYHWNEYGHEFNGEMLNSVDVYMSDFGEKMIKNAQQGNRCMRIQPCW